MSPATADPAAEIEAAEEQLQEARAELREAEGQLSELQGEIQGLEDRAALCSRKIREKHSSGQREGIRELRRKRRAAKAESEDLSEELPALESVVSRREEAVKKAQKELALARGQQLHQQAQELGAEIVEGLEELEEKVLELEELNADLGRVHSTLRHSLGYQGSFPGAGGAYSAAGLEPSKGTLRALREEVEKIRRRKRQHG